MLNTIENFVDTVMETPTIEAFRKRNGEMCQHENVFEVANGPEDTKMLCLDCGNDDK